MTTGYRNSAGTDTDNLFDPDIIGDGPSAAGYKKSDGTLLKYAAAKYGTAGPNTGYRLSNGADIATLWAAKGTASYSLPINGQTYTSNGATLGTGPCTAKLDFEIGTSGWTLVASGTNETTTTLASGAVPGSAVSVQITDTWLNATGDTDAGTTNNTAPSYTAIPSTGTVGCSVIESHSGTSGQTTHKIVILMKNAAGNVISTTTTTFVCTTSRG